MVDTQRILKLVLAKKKVSLCEIILELAFATYYKNKDLFGIEVHIIIVGRML